MGAGDEMIGKIIGDYRIEKQLGEGGMGVVFKGVHPTLGQVVAIKMLHPNLTKADAIKQRFVREAQAMARLRHPNILQLYNFIESPEGCFIVMEYVQGETFESILEKKGVIPPGEAIDIFIPTLAAMKYAHDQNIIHRDIKPSNIMLLDTGVAKIMDFGTAKMVGGDGGPALTAAGMTLGTVVYMSPEQLMGRDLTAAADIYSLGVTLFELCTGRLPFYHENEMQLMKMIMKEPAPKPTSIYPGMPKSLENAILKSIEKDRAKRFQSAGEFSKALEAIKAELGGSARPASNPQVAAMPPGAPPSAPKNPTPPSMQAAPEDTQTMKMPTGGFPPAAPPGATVVGQAAVAPPPGMSPLVPIGGGIAGLGVVVGGLLMVLGMTVPGAAVLGGFAVIGIVLLVLGFTQKPAAAAPGAAAAAAIGAPPPGAPPGAPPGTPALPPVQAGMAFLDVIDGSLKGQRLPLGQQPMTVGRAPDNNFVLKDPSVSSHHARLDFYQGKYFLSDLQSSNGTYVNNARIEQTQINHQDLVAFGSTRVIVSIG